MVKLFQNIFPLLYVFILMSYRKSKVGFRFIFLNSSFFLNIWCCISGFIFLASSHVNSSTINVSFMLIIIIMCMKVRCRRKKPVFHQTDICKIIIKSHLSQIFRKCVSFSYAPCTGLLCCHISCSSPCGVEIHIK